MTLFIILFAIHWIAAVTMQSLFLHRYSTHNQFQLSPLGEKAMHLLTYVILGPSYLVPRAYASLHTEHHLHSDTPLDPHSPKYYPNVFSMMLNTLHRYEAYVEKELPDRPEIAQTVPRWEALDRFGDSWTSRFIWVAIYIGIYASLSAPWYAYLLIPGHALMGPIHGAIVNWCGHRYGYRNYASNDESRNTLPIDFIAMGELFQNNHHRHPMRSNFATRWFELDPSYWILRGLSLCGIAKLEPRMPESWSAAKHESLLS